MFTPVRKCDYTNIIEQSRTILSIQYEKAPPQKAKALLLQSIPQAMSEEVAHQKGDAQFLH